jgi:hypothetical protein
MDDWLEVARRLPVGRKARLTHDCGEGKVVIASHNEQGYSAYCFRCGNLGFEGKGYQTLEELNRIAELNAQANQVHSVDLPKDYTLDIPAEQSRWLLKAGISVYRAAKCGIGWSPSLSRVIIPLFDDRGGLLYWQGRAVLRGQTPKYINPPVSKQELLYWCKPEKADLSRVVVTEDILSAIRVGRHLPAASILGTKLSTKQAGQLSAYDRVEFWLDPDDAGREGAQKGCRTLNLATHARQVDSEHDPKNHSDREIREILGLTPNHRYSLCQ